MIGTKQNKKSTDAQITENATRALIRDIEAEDPNRLVEDAGPLGKAFISSVNAAVKLQTGVIRAYVNWLRRQNPDATPDEIQALMSKQFRTTVATTGAGAGLAAAIPGVGLLTGTAAIAGESVLFLDLAAFYTVASAYLRGTDISDPERRRAVVLTTLTGAKGVAIVDTMLGSDGSKPLSKNTLNKFSGPTLQEANGLLTRFALRSMRRKLLRGWIGKLLPLGLGALAGRAANRKLADAVVVNAVGALGATPIAFAEPLPENAEATEAEMSMDPRSFAAWILRMFKNSKKNPTTEVENEID